jgi:hypothetical protein
MVVFLILKTKGTKVKVFFQRWHVTCIVVTYEIRVFFKGAQKEVFSSILKYHEQAELKLCPNV